MRIPITKRLQVAAELIGNTEVLCDIGCDHGYLPIYLCKNNQITKAYACDLRDGPLKTASKNIAFYHMKDRIKTVKSDGLAEISDFNYNVISICGMGGRLIAEIIEKEKTLAKRAEYLVLQPMSEIGVLRKYLVENGFTIQEERLALEDRRYYILMKVTIGQSEAYTDADYAIGKAVFRRYESLTASYLEKEILRYQKIYEARGGEKNAPEIEDILRELHKKREVVLKNIKNEI